ncbi:MAG: hypothetical protein ACM3TT_08995 [Syntrophothermus sp.]
MSRDCDRGVCNLGMVIVEGVSVVQMQIVFHRVSSTGMGDGQPSVL